MADYLEYLLKVPQANDLSFAEGERPTFLHKIGEHGTDFIYFLHYQTDPMLEDAFTQASVIGVWDFDGNLIEDTHTFDSTYFQQIRPFGNADDQATGALMYPYAMGWQQRMMTATSIYPTDNQPIILTMERTWDDTVGFEGWGWTATIEYEDPNRAPNARAIGIYDYQWGYLYTTGAFVSTEVGQDIDGNPIYKWQTKNPAGQATTEKEDLHYAMLFGAQQEGKMILAHSQDKQTLHFWEAGQTQPGQSWQDSGATVAGMAGTVTLVSDQSPFSVGMLCRINGVEQTVDSLWTTQGLVLTPYTANPTSAVIEVYV